MELRWGAAGRDLQNANLPVPIRAMKNKSICLLGFTLLGTLLALLAAGRGTDSGIAVVEVYALQ